jgi:hypothetical protein
VVVLVDHIRPLVAGLGTLHSYPQVLQLEAVAEAVNPWMALLLAVHQKDWWVLPQLAPHMDLLAVAAGKAAAEVLLLLVPTAAGQAAGVQVALAPIAVAEAQWRQKAAAAAPLKW